MKAELHTELDGRNRSALCSGCIAQVQSLSQCTVSKYIPCALAF